MNCEERVPERWKVKVTIDQKLLTRHLLSYWRCPKGKLWIGEGNETVLNEKKN